MKSGCSKFTALSRRRAYLGKLRMHIVSTSVVVQWLRLCAPNARGLGSIPG